MIIPLSMRDCRRGWLCLIGAGDLLAGQGWRTASRLRGRALGRCLASAAFRIRLLLLVLLLLLARSFAWHLDLAGAWRDLWLVLPLLAMAPGLALSHHYQLILQLRAMRMAVVQSPVR